MLGLLIGTVLSLAAGLVVVLVMGGAQFARIEEEAQKRMPR